MKQRVLWHKRTDKAREDNDFFPTDIEITQAFASAEHRYLRRFERIWEPACGNGKMAEVLVSFGHKVIASDIADRGYGGTGMDFLSCLDPQAPAIVTNPPYKDDLPRKFILHAQRLGVDYMALLLKVQFWNPQGNAALWQQLRPAREYKIAWRPDFLGLGGGMLDVCFWVWDFTRVARRTEVFLLTKDGRCL